MKNDFDTIVAVSSPPGKGAIAVIRLSGPESLRIVQAGMQRSQAELTPRHMYHCCLRTQDGEDLDEVQLCYMRAPASFTGEDLVEVFAHGGTLNLKRLVSWM